MATLAVIANAALVAFTMNIFDDWQVQILVVYVLNGSYLPPDCIRIVILMFYPMTIQLGRQEFIVKRLLIMSQTIWIGCFCADITIDKVTFTTMHQGSKWVIPNLFLSNGMD